MSQLALRVFAVALALNGCSSEQSNTPNVDGGGTPSDLSGASHADLTQSPPADLAPYPQYGYLFARSDNATGAKLSELIASLYTQPYTGISCTTTTMGSCQFSMCVPPGSAPPFASAGTLMLAGGTHPVSIAPNSDGSYAQLVDASQKLWSGGETLTLTAAGATIPAFSSTVIAPAPVVVTAPVAPSGGGKLTVSRSQDLTFTWTGGGSAMMGGGISATYGNNTASVTCTVPASAGTFTLPAALIGMLPASPTAIGLFGSSRSEAQVISGNYTFLFQADSDAVNSSNAIYSVQITLN